MNLRHAVLAGLCLLAAACGRTEPGSLSQNAQCLRDTDCAAPFACVEGFCKVKADAVCVGGKTRCNGNSLETCRSDATSWEVTEKCVTGCLDGACSAKTCVPNEESCSGMFIQKCLPNGSATIVVQ